MHNAVVCRLRAFLFGRTLVRVHFYTPFPDDAVYRIHGHHKYPVNTAYHKTNIKSSRFCALKKAVAPAPFQPQSNQTQQTHTTSDPKPNHNGQHPLQTQSQRRRFLLLLLLLSSTRRTNPPPPPRVGLRQKPQTKNLAALPARPPLHPRCLPGAVRILPRRRETRPPRELVLVVHGQPRHGQVVVRGGGGCLS